MPPDQPFRGSGMQRRRQCLLFGMWLMAGHNPKQTPHACPYPASAYGARPATNLSQGGDSLCRKCTALVD